jgi:type IV secretory pathway TraG/TraD family ATPase VirD4
VNPAIVLGYRDGEPVEALEGPIMVVGPTGAGKTTRALARWLNGWTGSAAVLSAKADLLDPTFAVRAARGETAIIDPRRSTGGRWEPAAIDLAAWCGPDLEAALDLTALLIDGGATSLRDGQFWYDNAATIIAATVFAVAHGGGKWDDVMRLLYDERDHELMSLLETTGNRIAVRMAQSVLCLEERTRSSVMVTARQTMRVFNRPSVLAAVTRDQFSPDRLMGSAAPGTVYLTLPPFDVRVLAPLLSIVLARVAGAAFRRDPAVAAADPLLLMVDEAAQIPSVRVDLPEWARTLRGAGVTLVTAWQSLAQQAAIWGRYGLDDLVANHPNLVLLSGSHRDPTTAAYAARVAPDAPLPALRPGQALALLGGRSMVFSLPGYWEQPPTGRTPRPALAGGSH